MKKLSNMIKGIASDQSAKTTGTTRFQEQKEFVADSPAESKKDFYQTNPEEENKKWYRNLMPITEQSYWEIFTL